MSAAALQEQFRGLAALIANLSSDVYSAATARASGSIGQHVRHCLDHACALVTALPAGEVDYDARTRGTAIERDPEAARLQIAMLLVALDGVAARPVSTPLRLRTLLRRGDRAWETPTTLGRELAFVIHHTIHHCAMIALLLERQEIAAPATFGLAPSTPRAA